MVMPDGPALGATHYRRAPHATGLSLGKRFRSNRTALTDAGLVEEPTRWVFTQELVLWWDAQPNEWRLSCAAELWFSQMEDYHNERAASASAAG